MRLTDSKDLKRGHYSSRDGSAASNRRIALSPARRASNVSRHHSHVGRQSSSDSFASEIERYERLPSLNSSASSQRSSHCDGFRLTLKIKYRTIYGQSIAVCGSHAIFGRWNADHAYNLDWHEDHIWMATVELPYHPYNGYQEDRGVFVYKYCMKADGNFLHYENGVDRIADLRLLPGPVDSNGLRHVELFDTWEQFEVNFMVYEPKVPAGDAMCVASERDEMGNWAPHAMEIVENDRNWLKKRKYGLPVKRYF